MLRLIMSFYNKSVEAIANGADFNKLVSMPVRERIGRFKYIPEKDIKQAYEEIDKELTDSISALVSKEAE